MMRRSLIFLMVLVAGGYTFPVCAQSDNDPPSAVKSLYWLIGLAQEMLTRDPSGADLLAVATQAESTESTATDLESFLDKHCGACHGGENMVVRDGFDVRKLGRPYVVAGSPDTSLVWQRVSRGQMPPPEAGSLSAQQRDALRQLIAPPPPGQLAQADAGARKQTILEYGRTDPRLSKVLDWGGMQFLLTEFVPNGSYTIFAPSNAAIEKLGPANIAYLESHAGELRQTLRNHVCTDEKRSIRELKAMDSVWTLETKVPIHVDATGLWIGDAQLEKTSDARLKNSDIVCSNGVIHIVDKMLVPPSVAQRLPEPSRNTIYGPFGVAMVTVPPGNFTMGAPPLEEGRFPSDGPQHQVQLSVFQMSCFEITREQYRAAMNNDPSYTVREKPVTTPVQDMTWFDAIQFCNKMSVRDGLPPYYVLENERVNARGKAEYDVTVPDPMSNSYRLPSEAEWEYACRAGEQGAFCFGNDVAQLGQFAWFAENSIKNKTNPVGMKKPNALGLYDMHGNVAEWCQDWYDAYPTDGVLQINPRGPLSPPVPLTEARRVVRGGSYVWEARDCRSAARFEPRSHKPTYVAASLGFRVVRYPPAERTIEEDRLTPSGQ